MSRLRKFPNKIDLALERKPAVHFRALSGARPLDRVVHHRRLSGGRGRRRAARCRPRTGHLRDDSLRAGIDGSNGDDDAAGVARAPDADAIRIHARLALQVRDRRAIVVDLVCVVQVGPLDHDPQPFVGDDLRIRSGIRLEQFQIVRSAAAEPVALIVDRHRHQPALGEPRSVLFDADRQRVDAVPDHHRRPSIGRS